jgi:Cof subfamily protein (haloacid dehalogenase superfamily)
MKKIFITDLDHTFLRTDLSLSTFTQKQWNTKSTNNFLSVATARTYKKTIQFLKNIHINMPMILLDGALIATMDKTIIDTKFIDRDIVDNIIDEGAKFGIYPFLLTLENDKNLRESFLHSSILNKYQEEVLARYTKDDNLEEFKNIRAMDKNFKIVYIGEKELLSRLALELKTIFNDNLKFIFAPEVYVGCYFLTILHKDADKSHGIQTVSDYIGFKMANLTVFGDNLNDLGMFKLAGTSVAVANAHEELKQHADIILPHTNDEDGVAKFLQGVKSE